MKKQLLSFLFIVFTGVLLYQSAIAQQTLGKWVIPAAYSQDGSNPIVTELTFHENGVITDELLTPVPIPDDPEEYNHHFSAGGYDVNFGLQMRNRICTPNFKSYLSLRPPECTIRFIPEQT